VGREGVGVFEKKEWRFRCPPELVFFKVEGVGVEVDDAGFLAISDNTQTMGLQKSQQPAHIHGMYGLKKSEVQNPVPSQLGNDAIRARLSQARRRRVPVEKLK
jgi:hypothetical protein